MIALIDYGGGNLRSVTNALARLDTECMMASRPADVEGATAIVFPGVGAAAPAMAALRERELDRVIVAAIQRGIPYLGICLGLQLLFESSAEDGAACLAVLPGRVERLRTTVKLPHVGWNTVEPTRPHPMLTGLDGAAMYFTHSYVGVPRDRSLIAGETTHGSRFASVIASGQVVAVQFHPERSGAAGLAFLSGFVRAARPVAA